MLLAAGGRLGPYEIVAQIGAGGMGEVYRARDSRVGREVAIKVSAERFSERFEREARAVAALNHPNVCTLYDVGPNYLVMELVEGEAPTGPLPLQTALHYARQIADALEAAHEKGIIHRDLKPAQHQDPRRRHRQGARLRSGERMCPVGTSGADRRRISPTSPPMATQAGMILGTAAYMAPEQARGKTGRQARRHLGVRRRPLRDADRPTRVRGRGCVVDPGGGHPVRAALGWRARERAETARELPGEGSEESDCATSATSGSCWMTGRQWLVTIADRNPWLDGRGTAGGRGGDALVGAVARHAAVRPHSQSLRLEVDLGPDVSLAPLDDPRRSAAS